MLGNIMVKGMQQVGQAPIINQAGRHLGREHQIIQKGVAKAVMKVVLCILAGVPDLVVAATVVEQGEMHRENRRKVVMVLF
nr:MAG TPA: hypothetical protein [Caudoviricetes sp.]